MNIEFFKDTLWHLLPSINLGEWSGIGERGWFLKFAWLKWGFFIEWPTR